MADSNIATLRVVGSHGLKRGPKPQPKTGANAVPRGQTAPGKTLPKSHYRPLPARPPDWSDLDDYGRECYLRIKREQDSWNRRKGYKAFLSIADTESVVAIAKFYSLMRHCEQLMRDEPNAAHANALRGAIAAYKRHHAIAGYSYQITDQIVDPDDEKDEDDDDFA